MPDKPRTFRVPDELYDAALERLWERRQVREGLGEKVRLALRAYAADPDAFEAACRRILEEEA